MLRYDVSYDIALSGTAATDVVPIALTTGASPHGIFIVDFTLGQDANALGFDYPITARFLSVSAFVAGANALTPAPRDLGGSACSATCVFTPTSYTPAAMPVLTRTTNSRVSMLWIPPTETDRIWVPPGGGAAGTVLLAVQTPITSSAMTVRCSVGFLEL